MRKERVKEVVLSYHRFPMRRSHVSIDHVHVVPWSSTLEGETPAEVFSLFMNDPLLAIDIENNANSVC